MNYLITGCLALLVAFVSTLAESKVVSISSEVFSFRGVADLSSPVRIELKEGKVDLSSVIQGLTRAKESYYYSDILLLYKRLDETFPKIEKLCKQSQNQTNCINTAKTNISSVINNITKEISTRIFYPFWYKEPEQDFLEAINYLNSNCKCNSLAIASSIKNAPKEQYSQLYNKLKNRNKNCIGRTLDLLAYTLKIERIPRECLQEENKNRFVCKKLLKQMTTAKQRFLELAGLIYTKKALKITEEQSICLECPFLFNGENEKDNDLTKIIQMLEIRNSCSDLDIGEKKQMHTPQMRSYTIKKDVNGNYSVPLTLKISPHKTYDGPVPKEMVHGYYINTVKKCMYMANQKIFGPNGEKLHIIIDSPMDKKDLCEKENTMNILIHSRNYHSGFKNFESDVDCLATTHELFHYFFGDEYRNVTKGFYIDPKTGELIIPNIDSKTGEPATQNIDVKNYEFVLAFDCRVTQVNSIMSDHKERWNNVFKSKKNKSLLDPGHFYGILYGDCPYINKHFNKCSQLSYKSSIKDKSCLKEKEECESYNILRRDKQQEISQINQKIYFLRREIFLLKMLEKIGVSKTPGLKSLKTDLDGLRQKLQAVESWPKTL